MSATVGDIPISRRSPNQRRRCKDRAQRRDYDSAQFLRHAGLRGTSSHAVKVGNRIETSGEGGWDDDWHFPEPLAEEIAPAFCNVERTLVTAGAGWEHVIAVNSCHLGFPEEVNELMTERFHHYMPNHAPIWTALGVAALGDPKMRVEIRVTAIVPE